MGAARCNTTLRLGGPGHTDSMTCEEPWMHDGPHRVGQTWWSSNALGFGVTDGTPRTTPASIPAGGNPGGNDG